MISIKFGNIPWKTIPGSDKQFTPIPAAII